jgi:hypothetical protein
VASGTPEEISKNKGSFTGEYLKKELENKLWYVVKKLLYSSLYDVSEVKMEDTQDKYIIVDRKKFVLYLTAKEEE